MAKTKNRIPPTDVQLIRVDDGIDPNSPDVRLAQIQCVSERSGSGLIETTPASLDVESLTQEEIDRDAWDIMQHIVKKHAKTWKELAKY